MTPPPPVVTVTLNPAIDQTLSIPGFAAGRVNRVAESRSHAGGKGVNVACFLADLGHEVVATGFLGSNNPELFEAAFQRKGIVDRFVRIDGATRIGIKVVDPSTQETTDINFPGLTPAQDDLGELIGRLAALAAPDRWFVLSSSVPAGLSENVYAQMIESIHGKGGRVLLDTSGRPLRQALASRPEVIKPNVEELSELVDRVLKTPHAVRAAAESLLERGIQRVVVSMGAEGAVFVDRGRALLAKPPRVAVRSTVGAGDAMVGGIVSAMLRGLPLEEVARTATAAGAYAVTRLGSGIEDLAAYRELMEKVEIESLELNHGEDRSGHRMSDGRGSHAADAYVDPARLAGKRLVQTSTKAALHNGRQIIQEALALPVPQAHLADPVKDLKKARAYTFGVALLASQVYGPMAAVMAAGMTPPLGLALAATLFKNRFTQEERDASKAAAVLGISFVTEGAIPFAAKDPLRVIPCLVAGSMVAGAISMASGVELMVPHGGVFVLLIPHAVRNLGMYLVALAAGTVVTAGGLYVAKRPVALAESPEAETVVPRAA